MYTDALALRYRDNSDNGEEWGRRKKKGRSTPWQGWVVRGPCTWAAPACTCIMGMTGGEEGGPCLHAACPSLPARSTVGMTGGEEGGA